MQHTIKTRFSIRLAGYALSGTAFLGMIAAVSFAGVRPGQPPLRFGGNAIQPYVHQEVAQTSSTRLREFRAGRQTLWAGLRGLERPLVAAHILYPACR